MDVTSTELGQYWIAQMVQEIRWAKVRTSGLAQEKLLVDKVGVEDVTVAAEIKGEMTGWSRERRECRAILLPLVRNKAAPTWFTSVARLQPKCMRRGAATEAQHVDGGV